MTNAAKERFFNFLEACAKDVGVTHTDSAHDFVSDKIIEHLHNTFDLTDKAILDVGCGTGRDLKHFKSLGAHPTGLTLYNCPELNDFPIIVEDQSFSSIPDEQFDMVYARHVLEHSPVPYFTIQEYARFLKPNGIAYVEVPAAGQLAEQELNGNHYSVLPEKMWYTLFLRSGFSIEDKFAVPVELIDSSGQVVENADSWLCFILRKTKNSVLSHDEWANFLNNEYPLLIKVK